MYQPFTSYLWIRLAHFGNIKTFKLKIKTVSIWVASYPAKRNSLLTKFSLLQYFFPISSWRLFDKADNLTYWDIAVERQDLSKNDRNPYVSTFIIPLERMKYTLDRMLKMICLLRNWFAACFLRNISHLLR